MGPVTEVLCTGYCHKKIEGINSSQPGVKVSQSDKRLWSYIHLKIFICKGGSTYEIGTTYDHPHHRLRIKLLTTLDGVL